MISEEILRADLEVAYREGREAAVDSTWRTFVDIVPTTERSKVEYFYGDKNRLKRFRGERQPGTFYLYQTTLYVDDWELTRVVKRQVLDQDPTGGAVKRKITEFGREIELSLKQEAEEYLRKGVSIIGFDKAPLISTSHAYVDVNGATHGSAVQSNFRFGGSQLDATTLAQARQHFTRILSDQDRLLGLRLTHVGVQAGSPNEDKARELNNSQYTVEASTVKGTMTENIFKGSFGILSMDYGLGASEWYAFDLSDPSMAPIKILTSTVSPGIDNMEYTQQLKDSESGFWRNEFAFGVLGVFDYNAGDWRSVLFYGTSGWTPTNVDNSRQQLPRY